MNNIKSYLAELLGTFILVFIGTGAVITALSLGNPLTLPGIILIALTFGLTLTAIIYTLGDISGAHVNPAVSIAATITGKLKPKHLIPYIIAQLLGATLASFFIMSIVGTSLGLGANTIGTFGLRAALLTETILTALFVIVILTTTSKKHNHAPLAIGFFLLVSHLFAIPISGSSLNPARSFGPAIILQGIALNQLWIYILAPVLGAIAGALVYKFIIDK